MTDSGALDECKVGHGHAAVALHFHRPCFELGIRMSQSHTHFHFTHDRQSWVRRCLALGLILHECPQENRSMAVFHMRNACS